jgi:hypothetical protein
MQVNGLSGHSRGVRNITDFDIASLTLFHQLPGLGQDSFSRFRIAT